jgi:hypothetical protein
MDDLFDGAIGIDLGTTYSYVPDPSFLYLFHAKLSFPAALVYGKMIALKSSPMTVCVSRLLGNI